MRRFLRPYSAGLFLLAIPVSYVLFVGILIVMLTVVDRTFFDVSDGIYVFSIWYGVSCYIWIPATWLMLSVIGRAVTKRRTRQRS
ncbi:UNVERIFIED_CONTAM: hypothetical protein DES50_11017 [Williamsia faeni]